MPTRHWLVDDVQIELVDRGRWGVTLKVGETSQPIPPMTLGTWPLAIEGRTVALSAKRNLDALRYQLVCDDHIVPRGSKPRQRTTPPSGTPCTAHETPATTTCPRCQRAFCAACAPDGNHCAACLRAALADERAAIARLRRIGVASALALTLAVFVIGLAIHSRPAIRIGLAGTVFAVVLLVVMSIRERSESRRGLPPATDI